MRAAHLLLGSVELIAVPVSSEAVLIVLWFLQPAAVRGCAARGACRRCSGANYSALRPIGILSITLALASRRRPLESRVVYAPR